VHLGGDDVVDPPARDTGADVRRLAAEHGIEGTPAFPVLVPPGSASQCAELQPDVVQIQLAQKEQRFVIGRVGQNSRSRQGLAARQRYLERRQQIRARGAVLPRSVLVFVRPQGRLDLEQQCGGAQPRARTWTVNFLQKYERQLASHSSWPTKSRTTFRR